MRLYKHGKSALLLKYSLSYFTLLRSSWICWGSPGKLKLWFLCGPEVSHFSCCSCEREEEIRKLRSKNVLNSPDIKRFSSITGLVSVKTHFQLLHLTCFSFPCCKDVPRFFCFNFDDETKHEFVGNYRLISRALRDFAVSRCLSGIVHKIFLSGPVRTDLLSQWVFVYIWNVNGLIFFYSREVSVTIIAYDLMTLAGFLWSSRRRAVSLFLLYFARPIFCAVPN